MSIQSAPFFITLKRRDSGDPSQVLFSRGAKGPGFPKQPNLGEEEYNFTPARVPTSELVACFVYEYARELALSRPETVQLMKIEAARMQPYPMLKNSSLRRDFRKMRWYLGDFFYLSGNRFFATSWQELDEKVRSALVKRVQAGAENGYSTTPNRPLSIYDLRDGVIFEEDLRSIGDTVETELRYVPETCGGFRKFLGWLGAMRFLNHYGRRRIVSEQPKDRIPNKPYSNMPDLYSARRRGIQLMNLLRHLGW